VRRTVAQGDHARRAPERRGGGVERPLGRERPLERTWQARDRSSDRAQEGLL
jgi:hypothetical protein